MKLGSLNFGFTILDFGFWIDSTKQVWKLENFGFWIYVSEAYAAQRVFFCPEGLGLYQIFHLKSKISGQYSSCQIDKNLLKIFPRN